MGKQQVNAAGSAKRRSENVPGKDSGVDQLAPVGFDQIEKNRFRQLAVSGGPSTEKQQRIFFAHRLGFLDLAKQLAGVVELRLELLPHFGTNLVAARVNARTDGGAQIGGMGAEIAPHVSDAFFCDPLQRASPTGMKNPDRMFSGINQLQGKAVCRLNGNQNSGDIRDQAIPRHDLSGDLADPVNDVGVNLAQGDERPPPVPDGPDLLQKQFTVLLDGLSGVMLCKAEIQSLAAVSGGRACKPGTKSVNQPGESLKRTAVKKLQLSPGRNCHGHATILQPAIAPEIGAA